jgi:hypothetical protein
MPDSKQFLELASGPSGIVAALASIPPGADNAIIRIEAGTVRWAETGATWINASMGLLLGPADPPFRIGAGVPLSLFRYVPLGGGAALQISYYSYHGLGQYL